MFFKNMRSRSKASTESTKHSIFRITSTDSHSQSTYHNKDADKHQASATASPISDEEADDYSKFVEKAKKDAEKAEKLKMKELREAERRKREVNMSPWGSRM
jgi:alanyl-tRNA synthetase